MIAEDLHWADATSLECLRYLARTTRAAPVALLLAYRPEEAGPEAPLSQLRRDVARERLGAELALGPLSEAEAADMLADILGRDPSPEARGHLLRLAQGNPFWLEELVRGAVEAGRLDPASGAWLPGELALPWTLSQVVLARVGRLSEGDRALLRLAALAGARIDPALLARAAERPEPEVLEAAGRFLAHGLWAAEAADPLGRGLRFRHALTREAVARELLGLERRRLHARLLSAAQALAAAGEPVEAEELLRHALGAGERAQAFAYSRQAAEQALSLGGYREAEGHLGGPWSGPRPRGSRRGPRCSSSSGGCSTSWASTSRPRVHSTRPRRASSAQATGSRPHWRAPRPSTPGARRTWWTSYGPPTRSLARGPLFPRGPA